jgi:hypothetical protein
MRYGENVISTQKEKNTANRNTSCSQTYTFLSSDICTSYEVVVIIWRTKE